jgi:hypothetical protein
MLLALASALVAQSVPPQPEARAIEAAQAEIEALWRPGTFQLLTERAGGDSSLRLLITAVRHPRHCLSEMPVRYLEMPVGAVHGGPYRFDWSAVASVGYSGGDRIRVSFREQAIPASLPPGTAETLRRARARARTFFVAPDEPSARRLAAAATQMVRACRAY